MKTKLFTLFVAASRQSAANCRTQECGALPRRRYAVFIVLALLSTFNSQLSTCLAQSTAFTYQGRVTDGGTNFDGSGQFKFALVTSTNANHTATAPAVVTSGFVTSLNVVNGGNGYNSAPVVTIFGGGGSGATAHATLTADAVTSLTVDNPGSGYSSAPMVLIAPPPANISYTTYWSNDGTSVDGSEPTAAVNVAVNSGLFTVTLGDATVPNMAAIDASLFTRSDLQLRIWFSDGVNGFAALDPAQNLTPAPYAAFANSASNLLGTVSASQISGTIANGSLPSSANFSGDISAASFSGNGGGLTNVNAATLGGFNPASFWQLGGNSGTSPGTQFFGTSDDQPLEIKVNGLRALRLEPNTNGAPNVIGGSPFNFASNDVVGATIGGGGAANYFGDSYTNSVTANFGTVGGGVDNHAGFVATVGGGFADIASGESATVGGGRYNTAIGNYATVGGGVRNTASNLDATVSGGAANTASGDYATVGGGDYNTASGKDATVSGGYDNTASGESATVSGGAINAASGNGATVPGGYYNQASGFSSFAAGESASATHDNSFVWGDGTQSAHSGGPHRFDVVATGGIGFNTGTNGLSFGSQTRQMITLYDSTIYNYGIGVQDSTFYLRTATNGTFKWYEGGSHSDVYGDPGVGGITVMELDDGDLFVAGDVYAGFVLDSDRNVKEHFTPLDTQALLAKVVSLPLTKWNYKKDAADQRHIGPVAQDFHAAFGLNGADDKHISVIDEGGVALAAIQGLNQKLEQKETEITELKARLEKLEQIINQRNGGDQ